MKKEIRIRIGRKLSEARKSKHMSQIQLAKRCNVSLSTIQRLERGEVKSSLSRLHQISEGIEIELNEFLSPMELLATNRETKDKMEIRRNIARKLRAERVLQNMSQAQLAEKCNLSSDTIQRLESGNLKQGSFTKVFTVFNIKAILSDEELQEIEEIMNS